MMLIDPTQLIVGMLISMRAGALLMAAPVFGGHAFPVQLRVALTLMIAIILTPVIGGDMRVPLTLPGLFLAMMGEALIGVLMALAVRMVFAAIEMAGHVIGMEVGLMRAESINPLGQVGGGTFGALLFYFAAVLFFVTGMHHEMIAAFARSFAFAPAGGVSLAHFDIEALIRGTGNIFTLGLQMAGPFIAVNFLVNVTFAALGKVAPKMNVFMVSFGVRILAGLTIMVATVRLMTLYIMGDMSEGANLMMDFIVP